MDSAYLTTDSDPRWVYHDVLISVVRDRKLNNGEPGLWARLFDNCDLKKGERVLQIGAGTGYYSAILAELVGGTGSVIAVEYDEALAQKAKENLRNWPQ